MLKLLFTIVALLPIATFAAPIDDYVWRKDDAYGWTDLGPDFMFKGELGERSYTGEMIAISCE